MKMKCYLKKSSSNILDWFWKIMLLLTTFTLLVAEWFFAYQVKRIDIFDRKIKFHFWKKMILNQIFEKKLILLAPTSLVTVNW